MKKALNSILVILLVLIPAIILAQSAPISIDGNFDDWTPGLTTITDTPETIAGVDLMEMQVSNDEQFLYISFEANIEFDLTDDLVAYDIRLYFDTDNNANTGYPVGTGFGSDLTIVFEELMAYYGYQPTTNVTFSDFSLRVAPTITATRFEIAIARNAVPDGVNSLFTSSEIKLLFINHENNDELPNQGEDLIYTFDETAVPPFIPLEINKEDSNSIRIVAYNTLVNGLTKADRQPHFENIITILNPDIIGFSECNNTSASFAKELLDEWIPLENSDGWYVDKHDGGDLITLSRWPILQDWNNLWRQYPTLIDLPDTYQTDLLFTNSHISCCGSDDKRQEQVDQYIEFILDAKSDGGIITLPQETPFVYAGDLNLVGWAQQLTTLLTGDIQNTSQYGQGAPPDWDETDVADAMCMQTDARMDYTWRNDNSDYPPGKLDYIIYSDAIISVQKAFVLQTEVMSEQRLQLYGFEQNNTVSASDHFPVVADLSFISTSLVDHKTQQEHTIYPNPASTILNIVFSQSGKYQIFLSNLSGKRLVSMEILSEQFILTIESLKPGIYFITIVDADGGRERQKFVKF